MLTCDTVPIQDMSYYDLLGVRGDATDIDLKVFFLLPALNRLSWILEENPLTSPLLMLGYSTESLSESSYSMAPRQVGLHLSTFFFEW